MQQPRRGQAARQVRPPASGLRAGPSPGVSEARCERRSYASPLAFPHSSVARARSVPCTPSLQARSQREAAPTGPAHPSSQPPRPPARTFRPPRCPRHPDHVAQALGARATRRRAESPDREHSVLRQGFFHQNLHHNLQRGLQQMLTRSKGGSQAAHAARDTLPGPLSAVSGNPLPSSRTAGGSLPSLPGGPQRGSSQSLTHTASDDLQRSLPAGRHSGGGAHLEGAGPLLEGRSRGRRRPQRLALSAAHVDGNPYAPPLSRSLPPELRQQHEARFTRITVTMNAVGLVTTERGSERGSSRSSERGSGDSAQEVLQGVSGAELCASNGTVLPVPGAAGTAHHAAGPLATPAHEDGSKQGNPFKALAAGAGAPAIPALDASKLRLDLSAFLPTAPPADGLVAVPEDAEVRVDELTKPRPDVAEPPAETQEPGGCEPLIKGGALGALLWRAVRSLEARREGQGAHYRTGAFGPRSDEAHVTGLCVLKGAVPRSLSGTYLRTGPNPLHTPRGGYMWFDGDAMLHGVTFDKGAAVSYSNAYLRTRRYVAEKRSGANIYQRLGDLMGTSGAALIACAAMVVPLDSAARTGAAGNTNLVLHAGRLTAMNESTAPFEVHVGPDGAITSRGDWLYGGDSLRPFTAHPKVDPVTGEMLTFGMRMNAQLKPCVVFNTISKDGRISEDVPVDVQNAAVMHDFAITARFAVFMDHTLQFDLPTMVMQDALPFKAATRGCGRIGLLSRSNSSQPVRWFEVDPYVCFHTVNAWDDGDLVHIVCCRYKAFCFKTLFADSKEPLPPNQHGILTRYTLNLATGAVTSTELLPELNVDFPSINSSLVGQRTQYAWIGVARNAGTTMKGLIKADLTSDLPATKQEQDARTSLKGAQSAASTPGPAAARSAAHRRPSTTGPGTALLPTPGLSLPTALVGRPKQRVADSSLVEGSHTDGAHTGGLRTDEGESRVSDTTAAAAADGAAAGRSSLGAAHVPRFASAGHTPAAAAAAAPPVSHPLHALHSALGSHASGAAHAQGSAAGQETAAGQASSAAERSRDQGSLARAEIGRIMFPPDHYGGEFSFVANKSQLLDALSLSHLSDSSPIRALLTQLQLPAAEDAGWLVGFLNHEVPAQGDGSHPGSPPETTDKAGGELSLRKGPLPATQPGSGSATHAKQHSTTAAPQAAAASPGSHTARAQGRTGASDGASAAADGTTHSEPFAGSETSSADHASGAGATSATGKGAARGRWLPQREPCPVEVTVRDWMRTRMSSSALLPSALHKPTSGAAPLLTHSIAQPAFERRGHTLPGQAVRAPPRSGHSFVARLRALSHPPGAAHPAQLTSDSGLPTHGSPLRVQHAGSNPPAASDTPSGAISSSEAVSERDAVSSAPRSHLPTLSGSFSDVISHAVSGAGWGRQPAPKGESMHSETRKSDERSNAGAAPAPGAGADQEASGAGAGGDVGEAGGVRSYLVIYDARTMSDEPVAWIEMPHRVPYGFHGTFLTRDELASQRPLDAK